MLWKHKHRNIQFVLVVNNFGIKYTNREDLDHLLMALQKYCDVAVNYDGKEFIKINLDWDYDGGKVHLSMEPHLWKALKQFYASPLLKNKMHLTGTLP